MIENLQPSSEPLPTIKVWSPNTISAFTFFLGFPSGITLASINWFRMGMKGKAILLILAGAASATALFLLSDNLRSALGFALNIGFIAFLHKQMRGDIEKLNTFKAQNAHWLSGLLTSLIGWGIFLAAAITVAFLQPLIPGSSSYYYTNGVNYFDNGDYRNAIASYNEALKLDPKDIYTYLQQSRAFLSQLGRL